jgi:heterodisulfide reductase subunit A
VRLQHRNVAEQLAEMPHVVVAKHYKYMCSDPGQDLIAQDIREHSLNRVVVASCSPRMHEITFRRVLENAGVNPYLFEMANIREQCSWVHTDREVATAKAASLIAASIDRVIHHEPLERREVEVTPETLVVGAGVTGMTAALQIADAGHTVYLVERSDHLGGRLAEMDRIGPSLRRARDLLAIVAERVNQHPMLKVLKETHLQQISGYVGNFEVEIRNGTNGNGGTSKLAVGNIILATGLQPFDPRPVKQYGYGDLPNVVTSVQLERMLAEGMIPEGTGHEPRNIVVVNCVGSRNSDFHEYCSRSCCVASLKYALQIRAIQPDATVWVAYTDMRSFGKGCEEMYERASRNRIRFMMFDKHDLPVVREAPDGPPGALLVELNERLTGEPIEVLADLVVLNVGWEPRSDAPELARLAGISTDKDGFFLEKHPKLDPVATTTDGVFIAGRCQGPKGLADSVVQGAAAAARVIGAITRGKSEVEAIASYVHESLCAGCKTCIQVCPYGAVRYDSERGGCYVNEVLCKGCGTCASTCPAGAIHSRHFTYRQIFSQIEGILSRQTHAESPAAPETKEMKQ